MWGGGYLSEVVVTAGDSTVFSKCGEQVELRTLSWGRFLKGGINYTRYNSYSRDKSAILGITIPGIKWVPGSTIYSWNSYSSDAFATLGINLPAKGILT